MTRRINIILLLVFFFVPALHAANGESGQNPRIILLGFDVQILPVANRYGFYSSILPRTMARYLEKKYGATSVMENRVVPFGNAENGPDWEKAAREIRKIKDAPGGADFIICGVIYSEKDDIRIGVLLYNRVTEQWDSVIEEKVDTGVLLGEPMDRLMEKVNIRLTRHERQNARTRERSPFIPVYSPLSFITFGMDAGRMYFPGSSMDIFDDTIGVTSWLRLDTSGILRATALRLSAGFFSTDSTDKSGLPYIYEMRTRDLTGELEFSPRLFWRFRLCLSAGGGYAVTTIKVQDPSVTEGPAFLLVERKKEIKPLFTGSTAIILDLSPVVIRLGCGFKRFYFTKEVDALMGFAGIGYSI
jgi:hypothetical protein